MPIIFDQNNEECEFALLIRKYTKLLETVRELHDAQLQLATDFKPEIEKSTRELRGDLEHRYARLRVEAEDVRELMSRMTRLIDSYTKNIDQITENRISRKIDKAEEILQTTAVTIAENLFSKHLDGKLTPELQKGITKSIRPWKIISVILGIATLINIILQAGIISRLS
jgi:hypothetical protein